MFFFSKIYIFTTVQLVKNSVFSSVLLFGHGQPSQAAMRGSWFSQFQFHFWPKITFFSCDLELWVMTFTWKLDSDRVKINNHVKYLGQRLFGPKVIVQRDRQTVWNSPDRLLHLEHKVVEKINNLTDLTQVTSRYKCWLFQYATNSIAVSDNLATCRKVESRRT